MRQKKEWAFLYVSFMRQSYILVPILIAALSLIGLSVYRLVEDKNLSDSEKETLSYVELGLSLIVPLYYIIVYSSVIFIFPSLQVFIFFLPFIFLIASPIVLTSVKLVLKDQLTDLHKDILVGLIILSTIYITISEFTFALGI